jgi:hypothetical protein
MIAPKRVFSTMIRKLSVLPFYFVKFSSVFEAVLLCAYIFIAGIFIPDELPLLLL